MAYRGRNICDRIESRTGAEIRPRQLTQRVPMLLAAEELSNDCGRFPLVVQREVAEANLCGEFPQENQFFA
ncbi:MAG: hypothetical protein RLZZ458_940 [Planctomycetota bacterium]